MTKIDSAALVVSAIMLSVSMYLLSTTATLIEKASNKVQNNAERIASLETTDKLVTARIDNITDYILESEHD